MTGEMKVLNPVAAQDTREFPVAARAASLDGVTLGLAWNGKPGGDIALERSLLGDAATLLTQAVDHLAYPSPRLIAIGGLSGTGKSTLARALAPHLGARPGAVVIRSDVVRKQLAVVEESTHLPQSAYTLAMSQQVYERVASIASDTLAAGYAAITDAVYGRASEREEIAEIAHCAGVAFDGLWLEGPPALLEQRIETRQGDASDATPEVLRAQLGFVTVPQNWTTINAAASAAELLADAKRVLGT